MRRYIVAVVALVVATASLLAGAAPAAAAESISVTPSAGLADSQNVTVAWSGIQGISFGILECDGDLVQNQRCIVIGSGSGPSGSEIVPVVATFTTVFGTTQNVD